MNYEVMIMRGWGKTMAVIVALVLVSIIYTQWAQARRLGVVKAVNFKQAGETSSTTLMPISTNEGDGTISVTQAHSQSGNGQVNDSNTDVSVTDGGDSISVTNSNHQEAHSGSVESDTGSATSGSQINSSSSHGTITRTVNGKTTTTTF